MKISGRHNIHDLCKILCMPLDKACEGFKTRYSKLDSKDFFETTQKSHVDTGNWETYLHEKECRSYDDCGCKKIKEFIEYGMYDVYSLYELYEKTDKCFEQMNEGFKRRFE